MKKAHDLLGRLGRGHSVSMKATIEISAPLLRRVKKLAREDGTTLRAHVEEGLTGAIAAGAENRKLPIPPLLVVGGGGLTPEFQNASWEKTRDQIYENPGRLNLGDTNVRIDPEV